LTSEAKNAILINARILSSSLKGYLLLPRKRD
jgi:hypothetical protein